MILVYYEIRKWVVYPKSQRGQFGIHGQSIQQELNWHKKKSRLGVCVVGYSQQNFTGEYRISIKGKKLKPSKVSGNFIEITDIGTFNEGDLIKIQVEVECKSGSPWQVTLYFTDSFREGEFPKPFSKERHLCKYAEALRALAMDDRPHEVEYFGRKIIDQESECSDAWAFLGMSATLQQNYSTANRLLKRAVEIDDKNPIAWNRLGISLINTGHMTESEDAFRKVFELESSCSAEALTAAAVLFTILIVTDRLSEAKDFVKNEASILENEHPDVTAELGSQWLQGIKTVLDMYSGSKIYPKMSYPSQLASREIEGFSSMISEKYKILNDKGLIDRAKRLERIALGLNR